MHPWLTNRGRSTYILLTVLFLCPSASWGEDAVVYFFTAGSLATTGFPGSKHGVFGGNIFDGQQRVGWIWRNHYLAVRLTPGTHTFSASTSGKHPAENSQASFPLEADKTYFFRVQSEAKGVVIVESSKGRIEQVTCTTAHEQAQKAVPTPEKDVAPELREHFIHDTALPVCP